jgi:hypothetical protein
MEITIFYGKINYVQCSIAMPKKIQRVPLGNHVQFSMEKNGLFADGFT